MNSKHQSGETYFHQLKTIEAELSSIWNLLSPNERQKRPVVIQMNRIRMALHRLIYSQELKDTSLLQSKNEG